MHVVLTYSDNILGSATGEKLDKRENSGKRQEQNMFWKCCRGFSVGYIHEMDSDTGRSVWQSGEY